MSKTTHVLVTGGAGFIGHHVIELLLRKTDWQITSLDRLDYSGNLNRLDHALAGYSDEDKKRVNIVFHDLKAEINPITESFIGTPDIILHIAAASHVDRSIQFPLEFVYDNIVGTANILEYARRLHEKGKLQTFLYFSTDEVFGPAPGTVLYKERDRYNSTNPYSASKAAGEELCVSYENTYQMPIMITHTMNVFGERQSPEKYIPSTIRKVHLGETVTIHSDRSKVVPGSRFYIHASDVADAIHFLVTTKPKCPTDYGNARCAKFNIVGKEEIDNLTLAQLVAKSQGKDLKYEMVDFHSSRPGHDLRYGLDGGLMRSLGWEPKIAFSERIKQVNEWFLSQPKWLCI